MPAEDAKRWDLRYQADAGNSADLPRTILLDHVDLLPHHGLALDIAMGLGANSRLLLQQGLRVIGVDVSYVAVSKAKTQLPSLMGVVADLNRFFIPENNFDVIIDFLYLQRDLWEPITCGLIKGGLVFIECLLEDMLAIHPEINPVYLLKPGELQQTFSHGVMGKYLEILYFAEGWQPTVTSHPRAVASLIAHRIS